MKIVQKYIQRFICSKFIKNLFVNFLHESTYGNAVKTALLKKNIQLCYKSYKIRACKGFKYMIKYVHKQVKTLTFLT